MRFSRKKVLTRNVGGTMRGDNHSIPRKMSVKVVPSISCSLIPPPSQTAEEEETKEVRIHPSPLRENAATKDPPLWVRVWCFCFFLRKQSPKVLASYLMCWVLWAAVSGGVLYACWSPFVRERRNTLQSNLIILNKNITSYPCCDITSCVCGPCDSTLPACFWLVQNLRYGACCAMDQCDLNRHTTSPSQWCQSSCGTCWNISRVIFLDRLNSTLAEFIQCERDDQTCVTQHLENAKVYVHMGSPNEYSTYFPQVNAASVYISIAVPFLAGAIIQLLFHMVVVRTFSGFTG
jgi:hypothetical protein